MGEREELGAALARAEAELARAVLGRAEADVDGAEAEARIEKARGRCRQIRALLAELSRTEPVVKSKREEPLPKPEKTRGREPVPRAAEPPKAETRKIVERILDGLERALGIRRPSDWHPIARQSLTLLALALAYLQYYFLDVQLQVERLPSIAIAVHALK